MQKQHTASAPTTWSNLFGLKQLGFALALASMLLVVLFPYTAFGQGPTQRPGSETTSDSETTDIDTTSDNGEVAEETEPAFYGDDYYVDEEYAAEIEGLYESVIGEGGDKAEFQYGIVDFSDKPSSFDSREYVLQKCREDQAAYPSATSCQVGCVNGNPSTRNWKTGSLCDDGTQIVGYVFANAKSVSARDGDGCFRSEQKCVDAAGPYQQWGSIQGSNSVGCSEKQVFNETGPGGYTGYCFSYGSGANEPYVGTGNTCFRTEGRCTGTMISTYGDNLDGTLSDGTPKYVRQRGNLSSEVAPGEKALCREEVRGQGENTQTEYCMNDQGLSTGDSSTIVDAVKEDEREQRRAELQARRDAFDAREEAGSQALKDAGALVQCWGTNCGWNELISLINRIIRFLITVAAVVVVLMIAWAGWKLVSARGNAQALGDAKSALGKAIAGFVLVLTAWLIVDVVARALLGDEFETDSIVNILGDQ